MGAGQSMSAGCAMECAGHSSDADCCEFVCKELYCAIASAYCRLLQRYRIAPDWLELEITESTLMHSEEEVITIMKGLVALGLTLTLDDFGTGYSSLTYLKRFPIACIKIDQSFVRGIPADVSDCAIASAIISMAKRLQLNVVAEGVETEEQLAFLRDAECAEVQGYLLAKPMSVDEYLTILRRQAVSGA
jgi:EAL domain-containing protein (putative c-di-GMP-specific phosphodiesterase class I)